MLNIENITLKRGNKEILNNITLTLHSTDKVGLVGVNGGGKTTLLKLLMVFQNLLSNFKSSRL